MVSEVRDGGRNAQLVRTLNVLRDLDRLAGVDLYELAERYGTIRRDLDALREAGVPLIEESLSGKRKRWRVGYKQQMGKFATLLDASHYLALRVAMAQGGAVRKTASVFAAMEDLATRIEDALDPRGRKQLDAIDRCFHSYEKFAYQTAAPDVLVSLVGAISERRICRVTYRAPRREPRDRVFDILPLQLFTHHGAVFLMCQVLKHDALGTLNLQRLRSLVMLQEHGVVPKDFNPERVENAAFGVHSSGPQTTYILRFTDELAPYIRERIWHPTQRIAELQDGAVQLEFTCGQSWEVSAWVASWRQGVEVIEPRALRDELRQLGDI